MDCRIAEYSSHDLELTLLRDCTYIPSEEELRPGPAQRQLTCFQQNNSRDYFFEELFRKSISLSFGLPVIPSTEIELSAMAMRTLSAISLPVSPTVHTAATKKVGAFQATLFSQNFSSLRSRASGDRPLVALRETKRSSSASVVRAAEVVEAVTSPKIATADISLEELKKKGDAYFASDTRPVILFDGVCNMCNGGVNFMLDNDKEGKTRFAALQSGAGRALLVRSGLPPDFMKSIVLVEKDGWAINSEAVLRIGQTLAFPYAPFASAALTLPPFVRDRMYEFVADNRYNTFGQTDSCRLSDDQFEERFIQ